MGGCALRSMPASGQSPRKARLDRQVSILEGSMKDGVLGLKMKGGFGSNVIKPAALPAPILAHGTECFTDSLQMWCSACVIPGFDPITFEPKDCQDDCVIASEQALHHLAKTIFESQTEADPKSDSSAQSSIVESLMVNPTVVVGVFDGHGRDGNHASSFAVEQCTNSLVRTPLFVSNLENAVRSSFLEIHQRMSSSNFDSAFSGTTAVVLVFRGNNLLISHVGDSRAIIGRVAGSSSGPAAEGENITLTCEALTVDHKPDNADERPRIIKSGGVVEPLFDMDGNPVGPVRVWAVAGEYPGIAMSRSLGDYVGHSVGVSADPDINLRPINVVQDRFIVLGSDGIWDVISNEEVAEFIESNRHQASKNAEQGKVIAQMLCEEAQRRWMNNQEPGREHMVDDISCIVVELFPRKSPEEAVNSA
eukprot:GILI01009066.1.p1 GENE.GILI01009066.1~~GILI01009066.1.p1  ORF type:complete len:421 (-),score=27.72 GILI01009066.1:57-1319(-)